MRVTVHLDRTSVSLTSLKNSLFDLAPLAVIHLALKRRRNGKDWNKIGCNDTKFCIDISAQIIAAIAVVVLSSTFWMCVCVCGKRMWTSVCLCVWCRCVARVHVHDCFCCFSSCVCPPDKHCWSSACSLFNRLPPMEKILPNICL